MKKNILFLTLLTLPLLTFAAAPCDSSKESCGAGKKPGLEELLSPPAKPAGKQEAKPAADEKPAEALELAEAPPEIPEPAGKTFENPGYLLLWLGIIAALYFYLGGIKRKKRAGK